MQAVRVSVLLVALLVAIPTMAASKTPVDFQGRIRANDAPLGGRITVTGYFLDALDDSLAGIQPDSGAGRWLLLRFYESNGKDAFVVTPDLSMTGRHRTSSHMDLIPIGRTRVGGKLDKDETRWALWWVPQHSQLDWDDPGDLKLRYGFKKTSFSPVSGKNVAKLYALIPWSQLRSAAGDSPLRTESKAVDAAAFDRPPVPKFRRDPPYPSSAKMYDWHGSLSVAIHVDPDGAVEDAYVLQSDAAHDLNIAALMAVMEWTFSPGTKAGKPAAGDVVVPIQFDLGSVK